MLSEWRVVDLTQYYARENCLIEVIFNLLIASLARSVPVTTFTGT